MREHCVQARLSLEDRSGCSSYETSRACGLHGACERKNRQLTFVSESDRQARVSLLRSVIWHFPMGVRNVERGQRLINVQQDDQSLDHWSLTTGMAVTEMAARVPVFVPIEQGTGFLVRRLLPHSLFQTKFPNYKWNFKYMNMKNECWQIVSENCV